MMCYVFQFQSTTKCVIDMLSEMQISTMTSPFDRRVTAVEWHPTNPGLVAVGSKGGDIFWWDTSDTNRQKFIQGVGSNYTCTNSGEYLMLNQFVVF